MKRSQGFDKEIPANRPHIPKNENALFADEVNLSANRAVLYL